MQPLVDYAWHRKTQSTSEVSNWIPVRALKWSSTQVTVGTGEYNRIHLLFYLGYVHQIHRSGIEEILLGIDAEETMGLLTSSTIWVLGDRFMLYWQTHYRCRLLQALHRCIVEPIGVSSRPLRTWTVRAMMVVVKEQSVSTIFFSHLHDQSETVADRGLFRTMFSLLCHPVFPGRMGSFRANVSNWILFKGNCTD